MCFERRHTQKKKTPRQIVIERSCIDIACGNETDAFFWLALNREVDGTHFHHQISISSSCAIANQFSARAFSAREIYYIINVYFNVSARIAANKMLTQACKTPTGKKYAQQKHCSIQS